MWIFTESEFVSIVRHRAVSSLLLVRARDRESLEGFCRAAHIAATEISELPEADYRFRVACSDGAVLRWLQSNVQALTYTNFKARAGEKRGAAWHEALFDVWRAMRRVAEPPPGDASTG